MSQTNTTTEYGENSNFSFTPNPTLNAETWQDQYPPIKSSSPWLVNKFTGEILPNTPELARRSDCLEPYLGELPQDGRIGVVNDVNVVLKSAKKTPEARAKKAAETAVDGELVAL